MVFALTTFILIKNNCPPIHIIFVFLLSKNSPASDFLHSALWPLWPPAPLIKSHLQPPGPWDVHLTSLCPCWTGLCPHRWQRRAGTGRNGQEPGLSLALRLLQGPRWPSALSREHLPGTEERGKKEQVSKEKEKWWASSIPPTHFV